jgi:hypothetical protein
MSKRLDVLLRDVGVIYADCLIEADKSAVAEAMSSATVADALAVIKRYQDGLLFSADRAEQLRSRLRATGPESRAYRERVSKLRQRCEDMQDPIVSNAILEREVRSGSVGSLDADQIRKSVLRLGGRRPSLRVRWARWVVNMDSRIQDLDRQIRDKKENQADELKGDLETQRERNCLSPRLAVFAWIGMLSLVGLLIWPPWTTNPNEIKAAQDIELLSRKIIPAGTKGIRLDAPCPLIDKSAGVSVSFRIGDQDIAACVRDSMITR